MFDYFKHLILGIDALLKCPLVLVQILKDLLVVTDRFLMISYSFLVIGNSVHVGLLATLVEIPLFPLKFL